MDMMSMTAVELGKKIKAGEISVMEATKACIENIKTYDKEYNCFITVDEEGAFKQAEEIQKKIDSGELTGPLAGVPIAIKDNMCQNGVLTTCASRILSNFVPTYTSDAVVKLMEAGAVIVGRYRCSINLQKYRGRHPNRSRCKACDHEDVKICKEIRYIRLGC